MILPSIINVSETALRAVPKECEDASRLLGATELETCFRVYDDVADGYFNAIKAAMIDLLMAAKYYERIGDHAVNITKWVLFSLTGKLQSEDELFGEEEHISER